MPKFKVTYQEIHSLDVEVEADSAQDAQAKVEDMVAEGHLEFKGNEPKYSDSIERSCWPVEQI